MLLSIKKYAVGWVTQVFEVLHANTSNAQGQPIGCKEECVLVDSEGKEQTYHIHRAVNCTFHIPAGQATSKQRQNDVRGWRRIDVEKGLKTQTESTLRDQRRFNV